MSAKLPAFIVSSSLQDQTGRFRADIGVVKVITRQSAAVVGMLLIAAACGDSPEPMTVQIDRAVDAPVVEGAATNDTSDPDVDHSTTTRAPTTTHAPPSTTQAPTTTEAVAAASEQRQGNASGGRIARDGVPTFPGEFADPALLSVGDAMYACATNAWFVNVPTLVSYGDGTGDDLGESLPALPAWSEPGHVWAPSVAAVGDTFVLHYTTRHSASGRQCISVAVGDSPAGPFVDDSEEPLVCTLDLGGSIDPDVIDDDGELWLLWKSDGNCCGIATIIFAQPLTADGTELAGDAVELIRNDRSWERDVVEAPSMIEVDGEYHLFYSANRWDTDQYAVGHAVCETVTGPCVKDSGPWLTDTDGTSGPGGLDVVEVEGLRRDIVVYHGWSGDEIGYDRGQRSLYARYIRWEDGQPVLVERQSTP